MIVLEEQRGNTSLSPWAMKACHEIFARQCDQLQSCFWNILKDLAVPMGHEHVSHDVAE